MTSLTLSLCHYLSFKLFSQLALIPTLGVLVFPHECTKGRT